MTRISTNVVSMLAQRVLKTQNQGLTTSLERLSTGLRINRGKDNPAGLIASENLRAEKAAISSAIRNGERAEQVVNVAEGGLQEINTLLVELQSLVGETANEAGISTEEKEANQLQIDSILQTIDRIANATTFNGLKLLNGNFDYTTSNVGAEISDLKVNAARLSDEAGSFVEVTIDVTTSAQTGAVFLLLSGTRLVNGDNGSITLEVTGNDGVQQFTFASGTTQAEHHHCDQHLHRFAGRLRRCGRRDRSVELRLDRLRLLAVRAGKGARGRLGVDKLGAALGTFDTNDLTDDGRDAIVLINGSQATTDGLKARIANTGLDVTIEIDATSSLNTNTGTSTFQITGGGANFNLSPTVNLAGKVSLGIETVTTGNLGNNTDGFLSALKSGGTANVQNGDLTKAQTIVDTAIKQVAAQRGRLGAFQRNVVQSTISNLGVTLENMAAAESQIRDTDFAEETANLTRQQILGQAATQALALANAQPQAVLALLG